MKTKLKQLRDELFDQIGIEISQPEDVNKILINSLKSVVSRIDKILEEEENSLLREAAMRCNIAFPENEQDLKWFEETCDITTDSSGDFTERLFAALDIGNLDKKSNP